MTAEKEKYENLLWLQMEPVINKYLQSNSNGAPNGALKAHYHVQLCYLYVASIRFCKDYAAGMESVNDAWGSNLLYTKIHDRTQKLTDFMDEEIGFPLNSEPNYQELAPKFFKKFIKLVRQVEE